MALKRAIGGEMNKTEKAGISTEGAELEGAELVNRCVVRWLQEHDNEVVCLHPEGKIAGEIIACIEQEGHKIVKQRDWDGLIDMSLDKIRKVLQEHLNSKEKK